MNRFILYIFFIFVTLIFWFMSLSWGFDPSKYMSKEILAKSTPINVKIDIDLMKSLSPAYEQ